MGEVPPYLIFSDLRGISSWFRGTFDCVEMAGSTEDPERYKGLRPIDMDSICGD